MPLTLAGYQCVIERFRWFLGCNHCQSLGIAANQRPSFGRAPSQSAQWRLKGPSGTVERSILVLFEKKIYGMYEVKSIRTHIIGQGGFMVLSNLWRSCKSMCCKLTNTTTGPVMYNTGSNI